MKTGLARAVAVAGVGIASVVGATPALGAITPTADSGAVANAIVATGDASLITGSAFTVRPPNGNPSATSNSDLALFPLNGPEYGVLGTGNVLEADQANSSPSSSTSNGGDGGGHGTSANDLVQLRIDLNVPADRNCLTVDYRFLTEEFPEFVGSKFNDATLIELDQSDFTVSNSGTVSAPSNIAFGPNGEVTTVNAAGTSADNALGTTYDGATNIQRGTTPITPGAHSVFITIYDANDSIYDSTTFVDNLRLRAVNSSSCIRGAAPSGNENGKCQGKSPNVIASGGVATGTKGDDVILGSKVDDEIRGRGGDDVICGAGGDDMINGNGGEDQIVGNDGNDVIFGNGGKDQIRGLRDNDEIHGQSGNDNIRGGNGADVLLGGNGNDNMSGNRRDDVLRGRAGNDNLHGNSDDDLISGGAGEDQCRKGTGNDKVRGCES